MYSSFVIYILGTQMENREGITMVSDVKVSQLKQLAASIRLETMEQFAKLGFGHVGGTMSLAEVLAVLYGGEMKLRPQEPKWAGRDWLVLSKGHAGPAVYSCLALTGFIPKELLKTLNQEHTLLPSHTDMTKTPGVDITTGSLGQGLSIAAGVALSHKLDGMENYIYCIIGDGESQEGQIWEAVMFAAHNKLDNLVLFVDSNKEQIDGPVCKVNNMEDYVEKFHSFGWNALRVDGHDPAAIQEAIGEVKAMKGKPSAIVLDTVKGKGVPWAEGQFCHHMPVSREAADIAISAIKATMQA